MAVSDEPEPSLNEYYSYNYIPSTATYNIPIKNLSDDDLAYEYYRCVNYIEQEGWEYDVTRETNRLEQCWQELELRTKPQKE